MDKEDVVYVYSGILLSHKRVKHGHLPWTNMNGPRDYHTKSDRERQMCDKTFMWNLNKKHKSTCLLNRNRLTDIEKKFTVTTEESGERDTLGGQD